MQGPSNVFERYFGGIINRRFVLYNLVTHIDDVCENISDIIKVDTITETLFLRHELESHFRIQNLQVIAKKRLEE